MWKLEESERLRNMDGVYLYTFDQCRYGCMAEKKTDLLSNILGMTQFQLLCNHDVQRWVIPWSGELVIAPHPPLKGRQWAVLESEWTPEMLRDTEPAGDYITRSCAAYPKDLNEALAKALCRRRRQHKTIEESPAPAPLDNVKVNKLMPLRGKEETPAPADSKNSHRDVHRWVTDKARFIGIQVRNTLKWSPGSWSPWAKDRTKTSSMSLGCRTSATG